MILILRVQHYYLNVSFWLTLAFLINIKTSCQLSNASLSLGVKDNLKKRKKGHLAL